MLIHLVYVFVKFPCHFCVGKISTGRISFLPKFEADPKGGTSTCGSRPNSDFGPCRRCLMMVDLHGDATVGWCFTIRFYCRTMFCNLQCKMLGKDGHFGHTLDYFRLCFRMFQIGWVDMADYKLVKGWLVVAVGGLWHGGLLLYNALVYWAPM